MTWRRTPGLLAVAALVVLAVGVESAQPAFQGGRGKIVFASDRGGSGFDVYVMTPDGIHETPLTNADGDDAYPMWSPDGRQIVFSSQRARAAFEDEIFTMNADGSAPTRLLDGTFQDVEPSWSRDGGRIAFRSDRELGTQIWTMTAAGTDLQPLTSTGQNFNPVWSPTANRIAFARDHTGGFVDVDIYTMNGDGSGVVQLTDGAGFNSNPDWSPDGTKIVFQSNRDGDFDIWMMNADGTQLRQVTNEGAGEPPAFDSAPTWSPDGASIAFQSNRDGDFEIFVMDAIPGFPADQLTDNDAVDRVADWQALPAGADVTPPVLHLPPSVTAEALWSSGVAVTWPAPTAFDTLDPSPAVTCSHAPGATFPVGTTVVSCRAIDASGNWSEGAFAVTVTLPPNTPGGSFVSVAPVDATSATTPVSITFTSVLGVGSTMLRTTSSGPAPPDGFEVAGTYFELESTATFDEAEVCFAHSLPSTPSVGHFTGGAWTTVAIARATANEVCVVVTSFSPFALFTPTGPQGDAEPPAVECGAADGAWHGANVSVACTASDAGSGLADANDASFALSTSVPDGAEDADAATATRTVCDRAGNCAPAGPIGGNKVDRKAPALSLPADRTVDATSPAGAGVSFSVSATDGADPHPASSCTPAPGSVFGIGTTTVACTAADHVGNTATGSFKVTVRGAKEQLTRLVQDVLAASTLPAAIKTQLLAKIQPLLASFDPANPTQRKAVCTAVNAFVAAARLLSGHGIPPAQATAWIADATRIRAVLGC
jgi:hypothetical protein